MRLELEQRAKRGRGRIRDQDIDAAKLFAHAPDHRAHLLVLAKVGLKQYGARREGANLLQRVPRTLLIAAVVERQRRAIAR